MLELVLGALLDGVLIDFGRFLGGQKRSQDVPRWPLDAPRRTLLGIDFGIIFWVDLGYAVGLIF